MVQGSRVHGHITKTCSPLTTVSLPYHIHVFLSILWQFKALLVCHLVNILRHFFFIDLLYILKGICQANKVHVDDGQCGLLVCIDFEINDFWVRAGFLCAHSEHMYPLLGMTLIELWSIKTKVTLSAWLHELARIDLRLPNCCNYMVI